MRLVQKFMKEKSKKHTLPNPFLGVLVFLYLTCKIKIKKYRRVGGEVCELMLICRQNQKVFVFKNSTVYGGFFFENWLFALLFSFLKFIKRQIVLFDAIEDAGFSYVNNMHGRGTLRYIKEGTKAKNNFSWRIRKRKLLRKMKMSVIILALAVQIFIDT